MTTPLFLLRCTELGLSMADLEEMSVGLIIDMCAESQKDNQDQPKKATQEDFDRFARS